MEALVATVVSVSVADDTVAPEVSSIVEVSVVAVVSTEEDGFVSVDGLRPFPTERVIGIMATSTIFFFLQLTLEDPARRTIKCAVPM